MNVMELLLQLPQQSLARILHHLDNGETERSKQRCIEKVIRRLTDINDRTASIKNLQRCERQLVIFVSMSATAEWALHELAGLVTKSEREHVHHALAVLEKEGWLFPLPMERWIMPDELKKIAGNFLKQSVSMEAVTVPAQKPDRHTLLTDLYTFIDEVKVKAYPLTQQKTIGKSQLGSLLKKLEYQEDIPNEKWRFGYGRHFNYYPDRFSLIYDLAHNEGWIQEEVRLVVTTKWEEAEEMSVSRLMQRFMLTYVKEYRRALPQLPVLIKILATVLGKDNLALEKETVVSLLYPFTDDYYYDDRSAVIKKRILPMLVHLGYLCEKTFGSETYYSLSSSDLHGNRFFSSLL
ncbi:hypothetical protein JSY36_02620 [Bacillus sp. H-16]|uniref:hypothetical protein n=1 Tax=Alteribacter salitolerans TaxID=2912333 RepID=UPI001965FD02|nr:hypothetical protein [Alteribacter salitolerans]MBM7094639.1 hypothetical protein [Alteribacter salitolerans]